MNIKPELLLDVMERGRFLCQIPYYGHGFPKVVNGQTIIFYDKKDLIRTVLERRPSLQNRKIDIEIASQRVLAK